MCVVGEGASDPFLATDERKGFCNKILRQIIKFSKCNNKLGKNTLKN